MHLLGVLFIATIPLFFVIFLLPLLSITIWSPGLEPYWVHRLMVFIYRKPEWEQLWIAARQKRESERKPIRDVQFYLVYAIWFLLLLVLYWGLGDVKSVVGFVLGLIFFKTFMETY